MNIRNARHLLYLLAATLCLSLAACASPKAGLVQEPSGLETRAMPGLEPDESYGTETSPAGFAETARVVVEGHLTVAVPDTATAANELRALVQELGGHVTQERLQPGRLISTVEVRLPPARVDELLEAAGELGSERDRSVIREDVSWQLRDAEIRLENLRRTMVRYEELLHAAGDVEQMLSIENELTRVRTEIDRIQGRRAFLQDRVALATIEIRLMRDLVQMEARARSWPGLRGTAMMLSTEGQRPRHFAGVGFSMMADRSFALEIDVFSRTDDLSSIDAGLITMGGSFYSVFFGDGERAFLNPHLGWALGYGWVEGTSNFAGLLGFGLELYRGKSVLVDSGVRWGLLAGREGPSLLLQPTVSLHMAF